METTNFPIVIDTGQSKTRVGSSINKYPQIIGDTVLFESIEEKEIFFNRDVFDNKLNSNEATMRTDLLISSKSWDPYNYSILISSYSGIAHPFKYRDGIDWNLLETFWTDIVSRELCCDVATTPVLLSEPHNAPFDFQDHSMEFFFESLLVPSFKSLSQELLSVNAIHKCLPNIFPNEDSKGSVYMVVHFGDSSIRILPIASGYLLSEYIGIVNLGGHSITSSLAENFSTIFKSPLQVTHKNFDTIKSMGIFDEYISNLIIPCLCDEIIAVAKKCPVDYLRLLLKNVLFIGGSSINSFLCTKFKSYFKTTLKKNGINLIDINVKNLSNSSKVEEKMLGTCSTWIGGSFLTRRRDFVNKHFFTREQSLMYPSFGFCVLRYTFRICLLILIFTKGSFELKNRNDNCVNISYLTLQPSVTRQCPNWALKIYWILYDVKNGEGFYLQRNVFDRMALFISQLDLKLRNEYLAILVLPPFCNIAHWKFDPERRLPWSSIYRIQENNIIMEYGVYRKLVGHNGFGIDVIGLNFEWHVEHKKLDNYIEIYNRDEILEKKYLNSKCKFNNYIRNDTSVFGGNCELMKVENLICIHFYKIMRSHEVSEEILKFLISRNRKLILHQYLIKHADGILVTWPWELKKYGILEVLQYNDKIKNQARLYMSKNPFFNNKPFISVHLRRNDFLFVRSNDIPTFQQVVDRLSQLSGELNISSVVVSTDGSETEKNHLRKLFRKKSLDLHIIYIGNDIEDGIVSAISQIILLSGDYFIGTKDSRFTFSVMWECILSEKRKIKGGTGINLNKCNEFFCGKTRENNSVCREHPDHLPITD
ncbi:putative GDP-fucose protein O-fucosyltransferase 2 [Cryptosporidium felis]|nr:putative GDP-fucose protein O-fucosyltransferase 2 [Cryptosporidium felis]